MKAEELIKEIEDNLISLREKLKNLKRENTEYTDGDRVIFHKTLPLFDYDNEDKWTNFDRSAKGGKFVWLKLNNFPEEIQNLEEIEVIIKR